MKIIHTHFWQPGTTLWRKVQGVVFLATPIFMVLGFLAFAGAERFEVEFLDDVGLVCGAIFLLLMLFVVVIIIFPMFIDLLRIDLEKHAEEEREIEDN